MEIKEFFEKHVRAIKNNKETCKECGIKLKGSYREVAHILPKSYFKSISKNDKNIIYLCEQHHTEFDNFSNEKIKKMNIFNQVSQSFKELLDYIKEPINYKTYDKYE